jgi:hypothetical protein
VSVISGKRNLARALGLAGVLLAVIVARVLFEARAELAAGVADEQRDAIDDAIPHFRRAARWYVPGSPFVASALSRLRSTALDAEETGDSERALSAWRSIRAAILSTRSFYTPHSDRVAEANDHIATLMASFDPPPIDAGKSPETLREEHLRLLEDVPGTNLAGSFLALLGFAVWVGAAFAFGERGIDDQDRFVPRIAGRLFAVIVVGFGLFVVGLYLA